MARNETGKMVRCKAATYERFRQLLDRLASAPIPQGRGIDWRPAHDDLTGDALLNRLMDLYEGKLARAARSKAKRRADRRAAVAEQLVVPAGVVLLDDDSWSRFGPLPWLDGGPAARDIGASTAAE